jgi:4-amino-4-deoxy-L-arabinose transferase-like glycosyltransferase
MKPVRLPASATNALPRWGLFALCLLYILPGLIGRDPWKNEDAAGFGIMWTMAHGAWQDWLSPNIAGLDMSQEGPLAYWLGAICIKLFGGLGSEASAARVATVLFFLIGAVSVWGTAYLLGRRNEAQPLRLAFGGQPEPKDYGRTLADGALLIYLGCLGLLVHSHATSANALNVSMTALSLYAATRFFERHSYRAAIMLGIALGLTALTHGWVMPLALWLALVAYDGVQRKRFDVRLLLLTLPVALLILGSWMLAVRVTHPFNGMTLDGWMGANFRQLNLPSWEALKYLISNGIWFAWPAWPYALWAVYAWRRQYKALHIAMPMIFCNTIALLALLNPYSEEGLLLPLLPSLAILAAFGLPTMKRGAINAVDWFSVMTLTTCAAFIWLGWIAKQTGWPEKLAHNAFKLAPGFKPEFHVFALFAALFATASWIALVQWRISRRPRVLWRAVVLSSGGVILCWLLLMTLWMPWGNYMRSYAPVAQQLATELPHANYCVDADVGPAQRASFAYFGNVVFARGDTAQCEYLLLQDHNHRKSNGKLIVHAAQQWRLQWEGRRASDRDEHFRLYRRING